VKHADMPRVGTVTSGQFHRVSPRYSVVALVSSAEATKSASESSRARSTSVLWIRKKRPSTVWMVSVEPESIFTGSGVGVYVTFGSC
jgi:hypothetical protein